MSAGRDVDDRRKFFVRGALTESTAVPAWLQSPRALVRAYLTGRWNHGVEGDPVLVMTATTARELGQALLEAADAAERLALTRDEPRRPR